MAKIDIFNSGNKYDILYTDPPWQQGRGWKEDGKTKQYWNDSSI